MHPQTLEILKHIKMEKLFLFIIGASLSFGVGYMGSKRKIGFGWAFFLSLCNLFLGLIATLCSKKLTQEENKEL